MNHDQGQDQTSLRARAERLLDNDRTEDENLSPEKARELLHELAVHRVELEMQNDELRLAQQSLELSRDQLADLYDFAPLGYVTLDEKGSIHRINLTAARMLNVERTHLVGRSLSRYIAVQDRQTFDKYLNECLFGDDGTRCQLTLRPAGADPIIVELSSSRWTDESDKFFCRTALVDVTARTHAEDQLRQLNYSLERQVAQRTALAERRSAQLQLLARRLAQVEHRERRRLAKMLHDHLQQMLVAARITTAMARRRNENDDVDLSLKQVDDLINESISLSRSLTLDLCPPVLHDVGFTAGLEWLARFMQEKHQLDVQLDIQLEAELEDQEMRVIVFEAARELLFNIVKHARAPKASLTARRSGENQIRLTVSDDGVGFDPRTIEDAIPNGFGLFNVRHRLELMGGRLEVDSSPGGGTRVTIVAPASSPLPPEDDLLTDSLMHPLAPHHRSTREPGVAVAETKIRVLLADDHEIVREGLASVLLDEPDIAVVAEARDGQEAIELALATRPDVVLMDVSMPRMDGIEATRRIKTELPDVRVIGLSMHEEDDLARAMRQAGAVAYLSKNGCSDALVSAIRSEMAATRD